MCSRKRIEQCRPHVERKLMALAVDAHRHLRGALASAGGCVAAFAAGRSRRLTDMVETTVVVRKFRRLQPCGAST